MRRAAVSFAAATPLLPGFAARRTSPTRASGPAMSAGGPLRGRTVLVTGASRGIGRGIAVGLGALGASVIATSRGLDGSLDETAELVRAAGGACEPVPVDHGDDAAVGALFARLRARLDERGEALHALVNCAYGGVDSLLERGKRTCWDPAGPPPGAAWDAVNNVGLRGNYVCGALALRQFAAQGAGVLVNVSSVGGLLPLFGVAYGAGKAAVDRLSAEMAREAPPGVVCFTYYPGIVATEKMRPVLDAGTLQAWNAESPLFVGRVLAQALRDDGLVEGMHGRIVFAAELGRRLGVVDEDGRRPLSLRSLRFAFLTTFPRFVTSPLRFLVPDVYLPLALLQWYAGMVKLW